MFFEAGIRFSLESRIRIWVKSNRIRNPGSLDGYGSGRQNDSDPANKYQDPIQVLGFFCMKLNYLYICIVIDIS